MVDDFGARIAKLRKARKLSQRALADRAKALDPNLRLSHSALGNYERNVTVPRLAEAVALEDVLDVSLDFLFQFYFGYILVITQKLGEPLFEAPPGILFNSVSEPDCYIPLREGTGGPLSVLPLQ